MSCINLSFPFFFLTVNYLFEYGALDLSRILASFFFLSSSTRLGRKALGTEIGLRFQGRWGIVKIMIGVTILGSTHPILLIENARDFP
jgi:hypothetical protein